MLISELFKEKNIKMELESDTKEELFEELVSFLVDTEKLADRALILEKMWIREKKMTTGIAPGVAIPHIHVKDIEGTIGVFGISKNGIDYDSLDGKDVNIVMMIVGSELEPEGHLKILKGISLLISKPEFISSIMKCKTTGDVAEVIRKFENNERFVIK